MWTTGRLVKAISSAICLLISLLCISSHINATNDNTRPTNGEPNQPIKFKIFDNDISRKAENTTNSGTTVTKRRLKILVHNPRLRWSRVQFVGAVADTLVDAGHEVHILSYSMKTALNNFTGSAKTQKLIWHERSAKRQNSGDELNIYKILNGPRNNIWSGILPHFLRLEAEVCQEILENKDLVAYLREEHYDFAISEVYSACPFGIFKHVGVKAAASANAMAVNALITAIQGVPSFSSFVYDLFVSASTDPLKMNFFERATNFFFDAYAYLMLRDMSFGAQPIFDAALGASSFSLREVMKNVSLAFVNSKEFFALPRPMSHKIIYIGGIAEKNKMTAKALPEHFKLVIDAAPKGAVLFSFGTVADTRKMRVGLKQNFADAFAKFPDYAFIWKLNLAENETITLPPNVHIFDWVPQITILEYSRTKLFISHCGQNSANEAAAVGVPVLGIPLFSDQPHNAATIANRGFGLALEISEIAQSSHVLVAALSRLLNDNNFAERARLISRKLALMPFSPQERLVKWVEFAAEFENLNELNLPTEDEIGLLSYYSLDVISIVLLAFALLGYVAIRLLSLTLRILSQNSKQKTH